MYKILNELGCVGMGPLSRYHILVNLLVKASLVSKTNQSGAASNDKLLSLITVAVNPHVPLILRRVTWSPVTPASYDRAPTPIS